MSSLNADKNVIEQHILTLLNLDYLPESQRAKLMDQMVEVIEGRLMLKVAQMLDEKQKKEFAQIGETGTDEELNTFIVTKIPDFLGMVQEEVVAVKNEMMQFVNGKGGK